MHHIDASAEQDRITRATASSSSGGGGAAAGQKEGPAARAIHMTIKSTADGGGGNGDEAATETMADRLRGVQIEPWKKIDFADEERDDSWVTYQQSLLLQTYDDVAQPESKGKGKKPAKEGDDEEEDEEVVVDKEGNAGAPDLSERVPGLGTDWGEDELLRAVSGIKADEKKPGEEAVTDRVDREKGKVGVKKEAVAKGEPGRGPRKGAAPRGGRTRGTAMEID